MPCWRGGRRCGGWSPTARPALSWRCGSWRRSCGWLWRCWAAPRLRRCPRRTFAAGAPSGIRAGGAERSRYPAPLVENRLSASDMSSLFAERGQIHVHVGGTIIAEGAPPAYERLISHVENRLGLVPRFRQRIVKVPLGIENPVWADDPGFDVRRHVRNVAIPRPGRLDQLRDLVGRIMSEPLDMEHPLWQLYLIDGLRGGRHAYLSKTHHALVDGVAA